jgi:hypothetical protein
MADEHCSWLDRDAAERLLRGEPLEAVDADSRDAADRLSVALTALTPGVPPVDAELPGEEAALAAFRKARAERNEEVAASAGRARVHTAAHSADAGLVRLGRPGPEGRRARWSRPMRFGMAAVLAAGMLGGVAVAAGTVILPTPFRDDRPEPPASVSAAVTPDRLLVPPSPEGSANGSAGEPAATGGSAGEGAPGDTAQGDGGPGAQPDSGDPGKETRGTSTEWWNGALSACRELRKGKDLDSDRKRSLEDAAGGKGRVKKYCDGVLSDKGDSTATGTSGGARSGGTAGGKGESGKGGKDKNGKSGKDKNGKSGKGGSGKGGSGKGKRGGGNGGGTLPGNDHRGNGGLATPASTAQASGRFGPEPAVPPSPAYSALGLTGHGLARRQLPVGPVP